MKNKLDKHGQSTDFTILISHIFPYEIVQTVMWLAYDLYDY
jgi:hypothetical protein